MREISFNTTLFQSTVPHDVQAAESNGFEELNNAMSIVSGKDQCPSTDFLQWCMQVIFPDLNLTVARQLIPDQKQKCITRKDLLGFSRTTCTQENVPSDSTLQRMGGYLDQNMIDRSVNNTIGFAPEPVSTSDLAPCLFEKRVGAYSLAVRVKTTPMERGLCSQFEQDFTAEVDRLVSEDIKKNLELLGLLALVIIPIVAGICLYRKCHGTGYKQQLDEVCGAVSACFRPGGRRGHNPY